MLKGSRRTSGRRNAANNRIITSPHRSRVWERRMSTSCIPGQPGHLWGWWEPAQPRATVPEVKKTLHSHPNKPENKSENKSYHDCGTLIICWGGWEAPQSSEGLGLWGMSCRSSQHYSALPACPTGSLWDGCCRSLDSPAASNAVFSYPCFIGGKEGISNEKQINKLFTWVFLN